MNVIIGILLMNYVLERFQYKDTILPVYDSHSYLHNGNPYPWKDLYIEMGPCILQLQ